MGRQKQNKPRRERSSTPNAALAAEQGREHRRLSDIAGMLDLPTAISNGQAGFALEVAAVGFAGDGADTDTDGRPAYVRLTDGSVKLLPEGLRPWARSVIASEAERSAAGEASAFPCRIEFGVADGAEYAELR